jgi:Bacterial Ig-like domain (group 3)
MKTARIFLTALASCFVFTSHQIVAQTSIQLFGPVNVRYSATGTSDQSPANFNSNTLNLSCGASPSATLSSTADNSGFVLVDNLINVTVTNGGNVNGPTNVCGGPQSADGNNCFTTSYQNAAGNGGINGTDPDTLLPGGGLPPIDISSLLAKNATQQVKIDTQDLGVVLTSSTLYLNTNCTVAGVSAPATVTGNPIPASDPTTTQLQQNFSFNNLNDSNINFQYDLTAAQSAGTLTITDGTIPQVGDSVIDPTQFQSVWAIGTSFATSMCLVHNGELLPNNGGAGCKLYTLTCTVGTGSDASGLNCPKSVNPNEAVRDIFDGPSFTLPDIPTTVNGQPVTFHEGMGFLMASEPWTGGACQFATGSGFESNTCPQNLLATFSGPGLFTSSGITTHPNSTFVSIAQVPEDLTTVTVQGATNGWVTTGSPTVNFSSQPPDLSNSGLPNAANFVPSPIQSITYGISAANSVPLPGTPTNDQSLTNSIGCPTPSNPSNPPAAVFTGQAGLSGLADGQYALHYFAKDCAGTEELKFTQDGNGSWSTNFYTVPVNVDSTAPVVATGPTLSPAGPYTQGQTGVTATFSCTDATSGVVSCGGKTFAAGTMNTGTITMPVSTSTPGMNTFTVIAIDAAGNQSSQSVPYTVNGFDSQVQLSLASGTVTYPLGTNLVVQVAKINSHTPTGTVLIQDGGATVTKLTLGGGGAAYYYIQGLAAGTHTLTAVYSGDANNPGGTSAPVTLKVLPVPVTLAVSCWNTPYPYGANFQCTINASSNAGAPLGSITYTYDANAPVSVVLSSGNANITIPKPPVGNHSVSISFAAQTNYAAAGPKVQNFVVTAAPVNIQLTPSSWYLTGGTLTLTASIQSWSAGPPNGTGQVVFTNGSTVLGTAPVNATGSASVSVPASSLANGSEQITATYTGGLNYATGSSTITITVAH